MPHQAQGMGFFLSVCLLFMRINGGHLGVLLPCLVPLLRSCRDFLDSDALPPNTTDHNSSGSSSSGNSNNHHSSPATAEAIFTGDFLFAAGAGKFFEGNGKTMLDSLRTLIKYTGNGKDNSSMHNTYLFFGHEYTLVRSEEEEWKALQLQLSYRAVGVVATPGQLGLCQLARSQQRPHPPPPGAPADPDPGEQRPSLLRALAIRRRGSHQSLHQMRKGCQEEEEEQQQQR